ncbi:MAG: DNA (cytosine-5-)-methyltransferase, partial [Planctomycetes bacterium]|nr:DNA (cytosine-5-)-methyltransferase [Planctomycetota bacterium]
MSDETRHEHVPVEDNEPILVLPHERVSAVWRVLHERHLVPQCWHVGGRFGGRIRSLPQEYGTCRGIPIPTQVAASLAECGIHEGIVCNLPPEPSKKVPRFEPPGDNTVHADRQVGGTLAKVLLDLGQAQSVPGAVPFGNFTFCELFAGIGGFRVALEALGGRCVFASEINADCVETYARNFHGKGQPTSCVSSGDIRLIAASEIPDHDLLVGGFPCQPFSRAGLQIGLGDGERGQLFEEIVRILRE